MLRRAFFQLLFGAAVLPLVRKLVPAAEPVFAESDYQELLEKRRATGDDSLGRPTRPRRDFPEPEMTPEQAVIWAKDCAQAFFGFPAQERRVCLEDLRRKNPATALLVELRLRELEQAAHPLRVFKIENESGRATFRITGGSLPLQAGQLVMCRKNGEGWEALAANHNPDEAVFTAWHSGEPYVPNRNGDVFAGQQS